MSESADDDQAQTIAQSMGLTNVTLPASSQSTRLDPHERAQPPPVGNMPPTVARPGTTSK